jgi:hypothetical protein
MGSKTRKAQCTTLCVCDVIKEKRSQRLRSILGVLPCSILRIWSLWARTKNKYTMDDFSTLTVREPWLLKRISASEASAWLAGKGSMLQGRRDSRQGTNSTEISKRPLRRKGWLKLRSSIISCTDNDFMQKLQNRLAYTFTYFASLGFWQLIIFKVQYFSKLMWCICLWRHYAHARAVWCSWCTLEWLSYPCDELVISKAIIGREGIRMASRFLTTKIP